MVDEVGPRCPELERSVFFGTPTGTSSARRRRRRRRRRSPARRGAASPTTRSTSSTPAARPASPRARRSPTTTSSTTATSSASCCGYTERDRRLHPGAVLPLLRHGHGQPRLPPPTARAWSSRPRRSTRGHARRRRGGALHVAVRRADDVHRRARPPAVRASSTCRALRTGIMAGSPCPVEVMKRRRSGHAHERGGHLLRHDRDVAGVDPDRAGRPARAAASARSGGCTRTSRSRSSTPRPARRWRAASPASSARAATA